MLNYIDLVMFAIQAAIKLGRKIQTVFEDETRDRELILSDVEHSDLPDSIIVMAFFAGEGESLCVGAHSRRGRGGGRDAYGALP
jgi:hypothetical protein